LEGVAISNPNLLNNKVNKITPREKMSLFLPSYGFLLKISGEAYLIVPT